MKISLLLISFCSLVLVSCYQPDNLPDKFVSVYNLALPIANDTVPSHKFMSFSNIPSITIPAGTILYGPITSYPFYLSDFTDKDQPIRSIEPKIVLTDDLPAGIVIQIDLYSWDGNKNYFLIDKNQEFSTGSSEPNIISKALTPQAIEQLKNSDKIYFEPRIRFTQDVSAESLRNKAIYFRLGLKVEIETAFQ